MEKLDSVGMDFIEGFKEKDKRKKVNRANHNIQNKRYSKLSLSLTKQEKEQIEKFRDENYPRMSISSMILQVLEDKGVFKN